MALPLALAGSAAISALGGMYAADAAADAQEKASKRAMMNDTRNLGLQLGLSEPGRALGYGAQSDLASLYGYALPAYQSGTQLMQQRNAPMLGAKSVAKLLKQGKSVSDIAGMGTLAPLSGKKAINRLSKAGLTGADIQALLAGPQGASAAPAASGAAVPGGTPGSPSLARFWASPDYEFNRSEGLRGVEQSAAARGGAFSGNAIRGAADYSSGLASREFGNYFNRLATLAGYGQQANAQAGNAIGQSSNTQSQLLTQQGDARASGIMGGANSVAGALNSGLNSYLMYKGGYFGAPGGDRMSGLSPITVNASRIGYPSTQPQLGPY